MAQQPRPGPPLRLQLFVAGESPSARRAIENRQRLVAAMAGEISIEVIDILARPAAAEAADIMATPTLSDESCSPARRLIGDLGDVDQVLAFFGHRRKDNNNDPRD